MLILTSLSASLPGHTLNSLIICLSCVLYPSWINRRDCLSSCHFLVSLYGRASPRPSLEWFIFTPSFVSLKFLSSPPSPAYLKCHLKSPWSLLWPFPTGVTYPSLLSLFSGALAPSSVGLIPFYSHLYACLFCPSKLYFPQTRHRIPFPLSSPMASAHTLPPECLARACAVRVLQFVPQLLELSAWGHGWAQVQWGINRTTTIFMDYVRFNFGIRYISDLQTLFLIDVS